MSETYNGWANYETWCVNLWIENEEPLWDLFRDRAKDLVSVIQTPVYALAREMEELFEEQQPELEGFWADLMGRALCNVEWDEIAKHYIDDAFRSQQDGRNA